MPSRGCTAVTTDGRPCGATRRRDVPYCFVHDPDSSAEATEARRLGGLHRRREQTVALVYDVSGIGTVAEQERLLEIAALDALALDNSLARSRTLVDVVRVADRIRAAGEREERLATLEAALGETRRAPQGDSAFARATRFEKRHR